MDPILKENRYDRSDHHAGYPVPKDLPQLHGKVVPYINDLSFYDLKHLFRFLCFRCVNINDLVCSVAKSDPFAMGKDMQTVLFQYPVLK